MNHLTDNQLRASLKSLVGNEREILHKILLHLREVDRRKLFSKDGFQSLRAYAIQELKYSEDQADRRIAAMRLLRDLPEAEEKIKDGSLSLSSLAQAQWHFQKAKCNKEEKKEILAKLENATKKETRAILKQEDKCRYSFEADQETEKVIERLRELHPHLNFDQLAKKVFEIALEKLAPEKKIERAELRLAKRIAAANASKNKTRAGKVEQTRAGKVSRYIPAEIKREVWKNSKGECVNCKSKFALEYDHIVPFAKGGQTTKENLRLLCRNCNQRKGIERYGIKKMTSAYEARAGK